MKKIIFILIIIISFASGYFLKQKPDPEIVHTSDTIYRTRIDIDTVLYPYPMTFLCFLRGDSIIVADSVKVAVETKSYKDSSYTVQIIGVAPELDYIEVYPRYIYQDKIINNYTDKIIKVPDSKRWGVGVSAGYGFSRDGPSPYIGISLNYNIFRF